jgi:hypothetical protein
MGAPLFASKPYFLSGDPMLNTLINFTAIELNDPEANDSYFDIEKWSGAVLYVMEKLAFNAELKPDALMPKLGTYNKNYTGYDTYMPVFYLHKEGRYRDHIINKYYGSILVLEAISEYSNLALLTIGCLLVAIAGGVLIRRYIDNKRKEEEDEVNFLSQDYE